MRMETVLTPRTDKATNRWLPLGIFLAAVATFVVAYHRYFVPDWVPLADSASNTMLVMDAKRLALLHGNYSRVGFYHPGPHLFYLMAAGADLFHDLAAGDVLVSLCATAATALSVVLMLPDAFTSVWVPYTYVTGGLLFYVGAAALIAGRFQWLWGVVLGTAILVSGHASLS